MKIDSLILPVLRVPHALDRTDNLDAARFNARQALAYPICGLMFQKATRTAIFRAATESEGDLLNYYLDEND